jgi:hypothetical protein
VIPRAIKIVPGLAVDGKAAPDQVFLPGHFEGKCLLNSFVRGDVFDLHASAPPERDVGIDPDRPLVF